MTSVRKSFEIKDTVPGTGLKTATTSVKTVPEIRTTTGIQKSTGISPLVTVKRGEMAWLT